MPPKRALPLPPVGTQLVLVGIVPLRPAGHVVDHRVAWRGGGPDGQDIFLFLTLVDVDMERLDNDP